MMCGLTACSGGAGMEGLGNEATAATSEAIYGGTPDDDALQNGAVVALRIGDQAAQFLLCTGALIAPNVVLTARHCISQTLTTTVLCDENGVPGNGPQLGADVPAASVHVFLGVNPALGAGTPVANGKAFFHAQTDALCNADMALVVLDRAVPNIIPLKLRLVAKTAPGETVRSIGYGQNDKALPIGTRLRKDNLGVLEVGKKVSTSQTALATNEFELGLSICQGDSGGPALSETTGAIVGVASRGGGCSDTNGHIYTSLAGFATVFQQAFALAGGAPLDESATGSPSPGTGGTGTGTTPNVSDAGSSPSAQPGTSSHPRLNLRAGVGNACSASGAPSPEAATFGGMGLGLIVAIGVLVARRRRGDDA